MKTLPTVVLALIGTLPMPAVLSAAPPAVEWHDVTTWGVEGRLWEYEERLRWFDRFPAAAEKTVPPSVWTLSRDSAGMAVRFETDAQTIRVRMKLLNEKLARPNMPATGVSGLDLYARDTTGRWRWVAVTKPEKQEFEADLIPGLALAPGRREYLAYLPLYNGVESLAIGVPEGAAFQGLAPRGKPIVFYGTSITHGACASRPGMAHVAILGRRLERPVANVGFSGNGRMDAAVGDLLARVDAACYVIDCLPNMDAKLVRERCAPLVKQLRAARPAVPIVLVEDRRFTTSGSCRPKRRTTTPTTPRCARHSTPSAATASAAFSTCRATACSVTTARVRWTPPIRPTSASCGRPTPSSRCCARLFRSQATGRVPGRSR